MGVAREFPEVGRPTAHRLRSRRGLVSPRVWVWRDRAEFWLRRDNYVTWRWPVTWSALWCRGRWRVFPAMSLRALAAPGHAGALGPGLSARPGAGPLTGAPGPPLLVTPSDAFLRSLRRELGKKGRRARRGGRRHPVARAFTK